MNLHLLTLAVEIRCPACAGLPPATRCALWSALLYFLAINSVNARKPQFIDVTPLLAPPTNAAKVISSTVSPSETNHIAVDLAGTNGMETLDDKYQLAVGDRLSFRILEDEEDPKPLLVMDSGDLEVPYIGRFPAIGKTCKKLAHELKAELEKEYYYQATVIIAVDSMTRSRGKVYLVGPVRAPGPQDVPSDEVLTLSKAILRAGGFSDYADKKKVKITRKVSGVGAVDETFTVNVEDILEKGRTDTDLLLRPGDLIYVPERLIRF